MTGVDVFGRASINSSSVFKIQSNGGLTLNTDFVAVKVDRNANNILSLSANGLMANGIKCTGGAMTGNLDMGGNQITGLEMTYPPRINTQATSWSQVKQFVLDYCNLCWNLNGNDVGQNAIFGTLDNFDIKFVRNGQYYFIFNATEILLNKNLNVNNFKILNLADPTIDQDPAT